MSRESDPRPDSPARGEDPTRTIHVSEPASAGFIGPYQLVRQIGEGGMGVVYHAQQLQPIRREVAIKLIKPGMDSKQVIARFESERQALALMDHANIARVFDAGTTGAGLPYFVMELVDGVPITRYCDSKRLTLRARIELFIPVCQAIQHAHQKGIIHRDIKPSNILVGKHDGKPVPKVIDFGLAKALGQQMSDATMMTNLGTVVGTLDYMSPEQADLSRRDVDTRSDVYSLGAVLYELLTGTTPLEHERLAKANYVEALQLIRDEEARPPSVRARRSAELKNTAELRQSDPGRLPTLLNHELDWIAMKALDKDRARRYETVSGLARDLQRYLDGEAVEAAPPSAAYRTRKFIRRHRFPLAAAAGFIALLGAGVVVSSWMAVRASRAEQEARAVNDFLQNDLLAQASAFKQARPDAEPNPHLEVRTVLDRAAANISAKFEKQPLVEASIRQTIGDSYDALGLSSQAQTQLERALELRRRGLGPMHPDTLVTARKLSSAYLEAGNQARAEALAAETLDAQRRVLGESHLETLRTQKVLAEVYQDQGKYTPAETLYTQVLETQIHKLSEHDPETLRTRITLGSLYYVQGKYTQAETLYTDLLEVQSRALGRENPDTLAVMGDLAAVYFSQGKYAQAEKLFAEVLEIETRVLGVNHPTTIDTMTNLAFLYGVQGKYAQAAALYSTGAEADRRVLGDSHPRTLASMEGLAWAYGIQGKYAQAEELFTRVLETQRRVQGDDHPTTLVTLYDLAGLYQNQGKYPQAESSFTQVLEARRRVLGPQHPDTLAAIAALGRVRIQRLNYAAAEPLLREASAMYQKANSNDWVRYDAQSLLGASLSGQRKYAEAEPLLLSGFDGMFQRKALIPAADRTRLDQAGRWIVQMYQGWNQPQKAAGWRQKLAFSGSASNH